MAMSPGPSKATQDGMTTVKKAMTRKVGKGISDLVGATGLSYAQVRRSLNYLRAVGKVHAEGASRNMTYRLA